MLESERLKQRIRAEVEGFFASHTPRESCLILDSTGMATTKHYLVLAAIGLDRLHQFREVHAFSGGAFAYFGFHGLSQGYANHSLEWLATAESEAIIRRFHHPDMLGPVRALTGLVLNKTAFGSSAPVMDSLNFIFSPEHLERHLDDFPSNLNIYLGVKGAESPLAVSLKTLPSLGETGDYLRKLTVRDLVTFASKVPLVYGSKDRNDEFFDAAFAPGYKDALRAIVRKNYPTLISTPWREGRKGKVTYVNCSGHPNYKFRMKVDFARLMLNLPNRDWSSDFTAAFL